MCSNFYILLLFKQMNAHFECFIMQKKYNHHYKHGNILFSIYGAWHMFKTMNFLPQ